MRTAPFGSWKSPVTSQLVAGASLRLGDISLSDGVVYFTESRPAEKGRSVLLRAESSVAPEDMTPASFDVRTRVHEYGGGAFAISGSAAFFSNAVDGRIYRVAAGAHPDAITAPGELRYAALRIDPGRRRLIAVVEDHSSGGHEPENRLVSMKLDGSGGALVLARGADFYASPRLSPDGRELAWLEWNHPNMPWDGTELWIGALDEEGRVRERHRVAGGPNESVFQPEWGRDGTLYFTSDSSKFWNLMAARGDRVEPVCPMQAEFGLAQWLLEMSTYAPLDDGRLLSTWTKHNRTHLGIVDPKTSSMELIDLPYTEISGVRAEGHTAVFGAAAPSIAQCLVALDLRSGARRIVRRLSTLEIDEAYVSEPRSITFPTSGGRVAHALFYAPKNAEYTAPAGAAPLLVKSHGGPTSAASTALNLRTQFYTSRGIGVLDVDYRGSTGYGRSYREELDGQWGVADVDDCAAGAAYLAERGEADRERLMITGGSAGGFTTIAALTFRNVFKAGASHYGISDLEALARDTHKFESRYLERLVGPYPEQKDLYVERSPIHHIDRISCPVIFFQGLEDKVVPPNQAEAMVAALRKKNIPVEYVPFPGEHHGFRRAENICRALDEEIRFFARMLKFELADVVRP